MPEMDGAAPPEPSLEETIQARGLDPVREHEQSIEVQETRRRQVRPVDALVHHLFMDRFDPATQGKAPVELNP